MPTKLKKNRGKRQLIALSGETSTPPDLKSKLGLLEETEVADFRNMSLLSLRNERARAKGPPFQRIGRRVFYPLAQLREYLAASTVIPGNERTLIHSRPTRKHLTVAKRSAKAAV